MYMYACITYVIVYAHMYTNTYKTMETFKKCVCMCEKW